ncbi:MAG: CRTAC1 family protein [Acidobacteria bacterium]|nr:CRTAC1 family protein [Acidobacteriota bacterium]
MTPHASRFLLLMMLGAIVAAAQAPFEGFPGFKDVAGEAGLTLMNVGGEGANDYIIEANGNGAAFFDYDNDGDMDVLVTNGSTLKHYKDGGDPVVALYENVGGSFHDRTAEAGLRKNGWAFGVCVADYDNDGHEDFYVTAYGPNLLFHNKGDGAFEERAAAAGVADPHWGAGCAFGDYDRDGYVDLYVANYVAFDGNTRARDCVYMGTLKVFCGPKGLAGEADVLYHNNGDGTFTDVTLKAGVKEPNYYGFGVVFSDLDNDGWPDIYVANDSVPNLLFKNRRDGTFEEVGLISGTSINLFGQPQAGMGVAVGDYDGNGLFDVYVTNFAEDTNTLYQNLGKMIFSDVTAESGAASASRPHVGWGTGFADFDNDGWLDLFVANGHVYPDSDRLKGISRYQQPKELYRNLGNGRFGEISGRVAGDLFTPRPARGAAFGDYDNDGDIDVLVVNSNSRPSLYQNDGGNRKAWIGFRLIGASSNRDAIGARVEIEAGGRTQIGEVRSGGSYLSHNDMRLHFGVGSTQRVDRIRIRWPNGQTETREGMNTRQYVTIREGRTR